MSTMDPKQDFGSLQERAKDSVVSVVKTANRIAAEDLNFQRTVNPDVADQLDGASARILDLSSRLLRSAADVCGLPAPTLEDGDDIDLHWRAIVDVVDTALEKADTALDEYTGLIKRKEPPTTDSAPDPKKQRSSTKVVRNANITKPQVHFEVQPDNFPTGPWKPILTKKPHATLPLDQSLVTFAPADGSLQYKHPYETEIINADYPPQAFEKAEPIPFRPIDESEPTWVDTYDGVLEMLQHLKSAKEIAVDLEHHDFRTYNGLVCLMQVSTRDRDWIVDTLRPWRHKLEVLNEVFADPTIVKVFHGSYMDMIWLQRDLGLYVNGLFDTYFACELLGYPGRGLAYLLSTFAGFTADKQYQLADWRMRPIPPEMMYYARSDTHYLLYIYDRVRNDLIAASDRSNPQTDLIQRALEKSREVSLYRHENPAFDGTTGEGSRGWFGYILKNAHLSNLDEAQFAVFRALWKWRDAAARKEDENPNFMLSTNTLVQIARMNPPDAKALHSMLPLSPPIARQRLDEVWKQVQTVKSEGGPTLLQFLTSLAPDSLKRKGAPSIAAKTTDNLLPLEGDEVVVSRLSRSQLFGDMPISTRWEKPKQTLDRQDELIPFPWQRFAQETGDEEAMEDVEDNAEASPEAAQPETAGAESAAEDPDQEFTLKRGRKRKGGPAEEEEEDASSPADEDEEDGVLSLADDRPKSSRASKKARRQEKRALARQQSQQQSEVATQKQATREQRRQAKAQRKEEKTKKKEAEEEKRYSAVPFDYSKATTVIGSAEAGAAEENRRKKDRARVFDPYVKSAEEGVKGARKAPPIRGERSATFKK